MAKRGFTIIELLVSVTIIGLLLGVATFYFARGSQSQRDTKRLSDVSLIAKAIDESTAARRGALPTGSDAAVKGMCADALAFSGNTNAIDYPLFSSAKSGGQAIPTDPAPSARPLSACTSVANGYFYIINDGTATNDAFKAGRSYIIEVGLELPSTSDESQFRLASDIGVTASAAGRTVYVLSGP